MNKVIENPAVNFAMKFLLLFALLYGFYLVFLGISSPGHYYVPFLDHHLNFVSGLRNCLIQTSSAILNLLGYETKYSNLELMVPGHNIILIGYDCLGFGVMCFFTAFTLAFPKPKVEKSIFLIIGLIVIQLLNVLRFVLLTLYWQKHLPIVNDHHTLFNLSIYIIIAVSLYLWINYNHKDLIINAQN